ncbi:MAG: biotin synthase BioB [Treponema sp.]|jgi:biotin synthase|nr:biotin synthase BioB [Treponema sp.]
MIDTIDSIILKGSALRREDCIRILDAPDDELDNLVKAAFVLRKKHKGLMVSIQILSNAKSGNCSEDCAYCAQSRNADSGIDMYPLISYEKLSATGSLIKERGLSRHCIGLSGIRFSDNAIDAFSEQVRKLKAETHTAICCSIGFLTEVQARKLKAAGVDRINHNLNTSRAFYPHICTTHTFDERVANIKMLQAIGFEICSGGIIGLGESNDDVVDMLLELQSIHPASVPINFLLPLQGTCLEKADTTHLTTAYCLKVVCLTRFILPAASIRCAAGREVYFKGHERELLSVVDSLFASGYLTADGQTIDDTIRLVKESGFEYHIE